MTDKKIHILLVCLGNICRSPAAEAIVRQLLEKAQLTRQVEVGSAGTGNWNVGAAADLRMSQACAARGYDLQDHRARQVTGSDFFSFQQIYAMDNSNLVDLYKMRPAGSTVRISLFLDGCDSVAGVREVPDPYSAGTKQFERVIDYLEQGAARLVEQIQQQMAAR